MKSSWDLRIERARELSGKHAVVAELLDFYQHLARFQKSVYEKLASLEDHDVSVLLSFFPGIIATVNEHGSEPLKQASSSLSQASREEWLELLNTIWQNGPESSELGSEYAFFARSLLQPYAEFLAARAAIPPDGHPSVCPFCGARPQVAVLRPEGDGGKRSLVCSLCATEWSYLRQKCPNCGEEHKDKLPVFIAEDFDYVRVEACETCHTYIKSIDMTRNGRAVPVVDELATVSLNLWAQDHKFQKFGPNFFGV